MRSAQAERTARWRAKNPERAREGARRRMAKRRATLRAEVVVALGGACAQCGHADQRVLQVDHINNDGKQDRYRDPLARYRAVLRDPEGKQLLCANCHVLKTYYS